MVSKAATQVKKGVKLNLAKKTRSSVHFHLPKTLKLDRKPRYVRRAVPQKPALDNATVLRCPVTTEAAMKMVEDDNTIVFLVARSANKRMIAKAFKSVYAVEPARVNTLIRPDGEKKAYIKIPAGTVAVEVASKIGLL